jgi:hypothetical protein
MDHDAKSFFLSFFAELERHGLPYVVLHSYQHFPERTDSDVDYAVRDADIPQVHAVLRETAAQTGWLLAQTLQYDIGSYYSVVVNPSQPGMFLKLDRCSHYTRNGCLFIRDEALLADRKKFNGFYIPSASSEFIYTLAKVFAKGKAIADYLPRLRELWTAEPQRSEELFHAVFGAEAGKLSDWFKRPPEDWNQLSAPMHARNRYRAPQRLLEWRRRLRRLLEPTGLSIEVAGKDRELLDKLVSDVEKLEEPCFRRRMAIRLPVKKSGLGEKFSHWSAYRRSTLIIYVADANSPQGSADLLFQLGDGASAQDRRIISLDACDRDAATFVIWREIALFLSRRDARRWKSLEHNP